MFLGLDIGTTAVKAIVIDHDQRIVAHAVREHPTARPQPGWCEQNPDDWIGAVRLALTELRETAPEAYRAVAAVGLSGQMHSAVLLGGDLKPIQPAILWNDARGASECSELAEAVPGLADLTGVQPMAGFTAPKLLWIRKHRPLVLAKVAHLLLAKDYVRLWLTGEIASDMSDAAGTQLFDEARRRWLPEAVRAVGLKEEQMPPLHEGSSVAGRLRPAAASEIGLAPGLPVATGGADSGTGALGIGCIAPGQGFISLGTAAVYVVAQDRYAPKPETMLHNFAHCIPDRWYQMAGMLNGASVLRWAHDLVGGGDLDALMQRVEAGYRGPSSLLFLPYLAGERTPHNNPQARGVFFGLDPASSREDLIQAVLEGVAFSLRDARECLVAADSDCPQPGFIGGGSRSRFWGQIIANVTGLTLVPFRGAELGPALGAARLAMIAATGAAIADVCRTPEAAEAIVPEPSMMAAYEPRYARFRALYQAVKTLY